jgi:hypothetical protein
MLCRIHAQQRSLLFGGSVVIASVLTLLSLTSRFTFETVRHGQDGRAPTKACKEWSGKDCNLCANLQVQVTEPARNFQNTQWQLWEAAAPRHGKNAWQSESDIAGQIELVNRAGLQRRGQAPGMLPLPSALNSIANLVSV